MPASMDGFVRTHVPGASRLEICHAGPRVVVHAGWDEIGDDCVAAGSDRVVDLSAQ
jgi:hypothetical protein